MVAWQPAASLPALRARADLLAQIRTFFAARAVMEVQTPLLTRAGVTATHIDSFIATEMAGPAFFLQTSPEYPMKRLLAAGSGDIYQIAPAFRAAERGRLHQPEFTLLEWYRVGYDEQALMQEVDALLQQTLDCLPAEYLTYQSLFETYVGFDPLDISTQDLQQFVAAHAHSWATDTTHYSQDDWLQWIMATLIEPQIGRERPCMVSDFPASQAALAKMQPYDARVAARFEVYFHGIELANGFNELTDPQEQRARFVADNQARQSLGKAVMPIDEALLAALPTMPACAGVALGIDRLLMLALGATDITATLAFDINRI